MYPGQFPVFTFIICGRPSGGIVLPDAELLVVAEGVTLSRLINSARVMDIPASLMMRFTINHLHGALK